MFKDIIRGAQREGQNVMILASVGHLKSTVVNVCMLQDILREDDSHLLFGSKARDVVVRTSNWLRHHLSSIEGEGDVWQQNNFCSVRWNPSTANPSWYGATLGKGIEGMRGNRGYLDDPIDRESQTSEVYRKDAIDWYSHTYRPRLNRNAHLTVIGSPWHPDDLYTELIRRGTETHVFPMTRSSCPKLWSGFRNVHWHGEEYDMLWPEQWNAADIDGLRREVGGTVAFQQRYMCNPQAILGARFKPHWFHYFDELEPKVRERLIVEMGIDPAISKTEISDNTSIVVIGFDHETNKIYVLENLAGKWDFNETVSNIKALAERYRPSRITIEQAAYQKALVDFLKTNTTLPVIGQKAIKDKVSRIDTLAVPIETGRILFRRSQHELIQELLYFPDGKHDDRPDSLEVAVRHIMGRGQAGKMYDAGGLFRGRRMDRRRRTGRRY